MFVFFTWVQKEEKNKEKEGCLHDLEDREGSARCPWERTATPTFIHFSRLKESWSVKLNRLNEPMPCSTEPTWGSGCPSTYNCCFSGSGKFPRRKIGMRGEQRWAQMAELGAGVVGEESGVQPFYCYSWLCSFITSALRCSGSVSTWQLRTDALCTLG